MEFSFCAFKEGVGAATINTISEIIKKGDRFFDEFEFNLSWNRTTAKKHIKESGIILGVSKLYQDLDTPKIFVVIDGMVCFLSSQTSTTSLPELRRNVTTKSKLFFVVDTHKKFNNMKFHVINEHMEKLKEQLLWNIDDAVIVNTRVSELLR